MTYFKETRFSKLKLFVLTCTRSKDYLTWFDMKMDLEEMFGTRDV